MHFQILTGRGKSPQLLVCLVSRYIPPGVIGRHSLHVLGCLLLLTDGVVLNHTWISRTACFGKTH